MQPGELPLRAFLHPIAEELSDPATREVVINRPCEVGIETAAGWTWRDVPEFTYQRLEQIAMLAAYQTGRDIDPENPFCRSTLPDGQRVHMGVPGGTRPGHVAICIRRPDDDEPSIDDEGFIALFKNVNAPVSKSQQANEELRYLRDNKHFRDFFRIARKKKKIIDIVGMTGSGKTHFLRRMLKETPPDTRALTIESDSEFRFGGPRNTVNFFFNDQHEKLKPELVVAHALRFRPDEIWFQETTGAEAWAVWRARAAGHGGGGTTWHGAEGKEIEALMLMMRQYPPVAALPHEQLYALVLKYVDIIVWVDRDLDEGFQVPRIWMKGDDA